MAQSVKTEAVRLTFESSIDGRRVAQIEGGGNKQALKLVCPNRWGMSMTIGSSRPTAACHIALWICHVLSFS
jgi:hypothetical protein